MNTILLQQMIEQDYVKVTAHPTCNLFIYNYTALAQYNKVWNEVTLACRGLILNEKYEIVARPFAKFFNLGEIENQIIPNTSFEIYDKLDGSLGILYWVNNSPYIASRGSFISTQANKANEMLQGKYIDACKNLDSNRTYLFEIIYPENRIVVDYGITESLTLLAIIDTQTGHELPLTDIGFPVVKTYKGCKDIYTLRDLDLQNKEGFVVKFANGFRVKIKFDEYLRLHRIITMVSNITIWNYMLNQQPFNDILEQVPDEFFEWVTQTKNDLEKQYQAIENQCKKDFKVLKTAKETALYFQTCPYPGVLFAMWHNYSYSPIIWKKIKPKFEKPFSNTLK